MKPFPLSHKSANESLQDSEFGKLSMMGRWLWPLTSCCVHSRVSWWFLELAQQSCSPSWGFDPVVLEMGVSGTLDLSPPGSSSSNILFMSFPAFVFSSKTTTRQGEMSTFSHIYWCIQYQVHKCKYLESMTKSTRNYRESNTNRNKVDMLVPFSYHTCKSAQHGHPIQEKYCVFILDLFLI